MLGGFFSSDGPMYQFLDKIGHLILLNVIWLLCCLPVITIVPSTTAFYYATIKSIRRGHGYAYREFFTSFKNNLARGIPLSLVLAALGLLLTFNFKVAWRAQTKESMAFAILYLVLLFFYAGFMIYICPVLSRFSIRMRPLVRMAAVMVFRHLPVTILLMAGTGACGLFLYSAVAASQSETDTSPMLAMLFLLPGIWCFASTYLVEPVLKKYMPQKPEGDKSWYYE